MNSAYTRSKKGRLEKSSVPGKPTINVIHIDQPMNAGNSSQISDLSDSQQLDNGSSLQAIKGRPSGSTNSNKRKRKQEIIAMKNDIAKEYSELKRDGKRLKNGKIKDIIQKHKILKNLEDVDVPVKTN